MLKNNCIVISTIEELFFFFLFRMCTLVPSGNLTPQLHKHGVIAEFICNYHLYFAYFTSVYSLIILFWLFCQLWLNAHDKSWSCHIGENGYLSFFVQKKNPDSCNMWRRAQNQFLKGTSPSYQESFTHHNIASFLCSPVLVHCSKCSHLFGLLCFLSPTEIIKKIIHFSICVHLLYVNLSA